MIRVSATQPLRHRRLTRGSVGLIQNVLVNHTHWELTMGCCGDPVDAAPQQQTTHAHYGTITQQPGLQPGLEKAVFQQPTILTPPPAHGANGAPAPWGQSYTPQPVNQFGGYTSPPLTNGQSYNGSMFNGSSTFASSNEPLARPGSAHHSHQPSFGSGSPPPQIPAFPKVASPPPDEGKMSISIDFGIFIVLYLLPLH